MHSSKRPPGSGSRTRKGMPQNKDFDVPNPFNPLGPGIPFRFPTPTDGGGGEMGNPKPSRTRPGGRGTGLPGVRPGGGRPDRPGRGSGASPGATPIKPDKDKGTGGRPGRGGGRPRSKRSK
jgi:hypothetical protein